MTLDTLFFAIILGLSIAASAMIAERIPRRSRTQLRAASALYFFLALTALLGARFPDLAYGLAVFTSVLAAFSLALAFVKAVRGRGLARARLTAVQAAAAIACCLCVVAIVSVDAWRVPGSALLFAAAGLLGSALALERLLRPIIDRGSDRIAWRTISR